MMNENTTMTQAQVEGFGIDAKVPMVPQDRLCKGICIVYRTGTKGNYGVG